MGSIPLGLQFLENEYVVSNRDNLHIYTNALERLLNNLNGQISCAITLMRKLVRIKVNEQGFFFSFAH